MNKRAVLITGTSSGLGLEIALSLAARQYRVFATVRDLSGRSKLEWEAKKRQVSLRVMELDTRDNTSIHVAIATILEETGELYAVVNNAGSIMWGYFEDLTDGELRDVYDTNVFGTMAVTRACLPVMRKAGRGRIVIISSTAGRLAVPGNSAYSSSKFALEGFGEALAQELHPFNIQVSLIEPSLVVTDLFGRNRRVAKGAFDKGSIYQKCLENLEQLTTDRLSRNLVTPADVANTVYQALETKRPRLRYIVGNRAKWLLGIRRFAPGEMFDRVWLRLVTRRLTRA